MEARLNHSDENIELNLQNARYQHAFQCEHINIACDAFETSKEFDDILQAVVNFLKPFDIKTLVMHHLPPIGAPDFNEKHVIKKCINHEDMILANAIESGVNQIIRSRTVDATGPIFWSNNTALENFQPNKEEFEHQLPCSEKIRGVTFVVYGSAGRNGIISLVFRDLERRYTKEEIRMLLFGFTSAHQVFCRLKEALLGKPPKLTRREKEILEWVARGKSNNIIAEITNISTHTVSTYMRRIFMKTGTNDRISAVLYAISRGLIDMDNDIQKVRLDLAT